jgi:hypothetical protein
MEYDDENPEESFERKTHGDLIALKKLIIVAWAKYFRGPETKRFKQGSVSIILERFKISMSALFKIMK